MFWQLKLEQRAGRVFKGWEEGRIEFAPTYKYITNSDHYVALTSNLKPSKEKRRTPAWYVLLILLILQQSNLISMKLINLPKGKCF